MVDQRDGTKEIFEATFHENIQGTLAQGEAGLVEGNLPLATMLSKAVLRPPETELAYLITDEQRQQATLVLADALVRLSEELKDAAVAAAGAMLASSARQNSTKDSPERERANQITTNGWRSYYDDENEVGLNLMYGGDTKVQSPAHAHALLDAAWAFHLNGTDTWACNIVSHAGFEEVELDDSFYWNMEDLCGEMGHRLPEYAHKRAVMGA